MISLERLSHHVHRAEAFLGQRSPAGIQGLREHLQPYRDDLEHAGLPSYRLGTIISLLHYYDPSRTHDRFINQIIEGAGVLLRRSRLLPFQGQDPAALHHELQTLLEGTYQQDERALRLVTRQVIFSGELSMSTILGLKRHGVECPF